MRKIAREVAEASHVLQNELPAAQRAPRNQNLVIEEARRLERLMAKRRRLRRELRVVDADIKHARKMLKAFAGVNVEGL
jgi:ribosomal protein L35